MTIFYSLICFMYHPPFTKTYIQLYSTIFSATKCYSVTLAGFTANPQGTLGIFHQSLGLIFALSVIFAALKTVKVYSLPNSSADKKKS